MCESSLRRCSSVVRIPIETVGTRKRKNISPVIVVVAGVARFNDLLKANPSLKPYLPEAIISAYPEAVELASDETGLPQSIFPTICTYLIEQLLDKNFVTT